MNDVPCRIAQAHTAAEQIRKWDEGNREERKLGKTENVKLSPFPSQIKMKVKRSQMKESTWEGER